MRGSEAEDVYMKSLYFLVGLAGVYMLLWIGQIPWLIIPKDLHPDLVTWWFPRGLLGLAIISVGGGLCFLLVGMGYEICKKIKAFGEFIYEEIL